MAKKRKKKARSATTLKWMAALVFLAALGTGFLATQVRGAAPATPSSSDKLKTAATATATAAAEYVNETKEEFQAKMQKNLAEIERNIAELRSQLSKSGGELRTETRAELERRLAALEKQRDELQSQLDRLGRSSGRAWEKMRSGLEKAWGEIRSSYQSAKDEFAAKKSEEKRTEKRDHEKKQK